MDGQCHSFMMDYIPMELQGYSPSGCSDTGGVIFAKTPPPTIPTADGIDVYRRRVKINLYQNINILKTLIYTLKTLNKLLDIVFQKNK